MANDTVTEIEQTAENVAGKFLRDLVDHGEKLVAADLPYDVRKVLGALVHWTGNGGSFKEPDVFNPALSAEVAQAEATASRLASENADLSKRLAAIETLLVQQAQVPQASPVPMARRPSEGAAPAVPAPAPAPAVPVVPPAPAVPVVTAPPEAAPAVPAPEPPASA